MRKISFITQTLAGLSCAYTSQAMALNSIDIRSSSGLIKFDFEYPIAKGNKLVRPCVVQAEVWRFISEKPIADSGKVYSVTLNSESLAQLQEGLTQQEVEGNCVLVLDVGANLTVRISKKMGQLKVQGKIVHKPLENIRGDWDYSPSVASGPAHQRIFTIARRFVGQLFNYNIDSQCAVFARTVLSQACGRKIRGVVTQRNSNFETLGSRTPLEYRRTLSNLCKFLGERRIWKSHFSH